MYNPRIESYFGTHECKLVYTILMNKLNVNLVDNTYFNEMLYIDIYY